MIYYLINLFRPLLEAVQPPAMPPVAGADKRRQVSTARPVSHLHSPKGVFIRGSSSHARHHISASWEGESRGIQRGGAGWSGQPPPD